MIFSRFKPFDFINTSKLFLIPLLFPLLSYSSEPDKLIGARASGLGNSAIALTDSWSIFNNQAGLGWQRDYWAGVYHENRYFVKELNYSSLGGCIPVKPGTFGIAITHFGYSQYSQSRFGLSYGMMLTKTIAAGVGFNYHTVQLAGGYGSSNCLTAEGGIIYQPLEKVAIGAYLFNPTHSSLGNNQKLATFFGIGLTYRPSKYILITLQGDDNTQSSPVFRTGLEYSPAKNLYFRAGMSSNPMSLAFGLGWKVKSVDFDLAFSYHEVLGYTPFLSVSYTFNSKTSKQDKPEK
ncbi:MAG: hypothetical protein HOO91_19740 [Bacteroidales bacterium]|nr:hypothetical protein [Bacteroidales bacterium]